MSAPPMESVCRSAHAGVVLALDAVGGLDERDGVLVIRAELLDATAANGHDLDHAHRHRTVRDPRDRGPRGKCDHTITTTVDVLHLDAVGDVPELAELITHLEESVVTDVGATVWKRRRGEEDHIGVEDREDLLLAVLRGFVICLLERRHHQRLEPLHDIDILLGHGNTSSDGWVRGQVSRGKAPTSWGCVTMGE